MSEDVCRRDMLLVFMARILEEEFGSEALDVLMEWRDKKTRERWKEIARTSGRSDPEYLFRLFDERVHEFEVIRKDRRVLEVKVTRCAHADTFKRFNAADIGQKLICNGDIAVVEGFNPRMKFTRSKLLMAGDDCCHFKFELEE
ncbi:MAG: L-2-amino-thiazoline-4-carboxylic acid hydrolase [Candidatus Bathyarchaeia archaeon]